MRKFKSIEELNLFFGYNVGNSILNSSQLDEKKSPLLKTKPHLLYDKKKLEDKWWASSYRGVLTSQEKFFLHLSIRLLSFAGEEVEFNFDPKTSYDRDHNNIYVNGQFWYADRVIFNHGNPYEIWESEQNSSDTAIAKGYALTSDGFWRKHTWLVTRKGRKVRIIETTNEPKVAYYGYILEEKDALALKDK